MQHIKKQFGAAVADQSGAVAILFGLMTMVLFGSIALAIDFSIQSSKQQDMQNAVDAASLAAASMLNATDAERMARGKKVFQQNYSDHGDAAFDISVVGKSIKSTATTKLKPHILPIFSIDKLDVAANSTVPMAATGSAEVVFVLDYSDSMLDNNKYVRMGTAAKEMLDIISDNGENKEIEAGIVPFAAMVHVDLPAWAIRSDVTYTGCTQDRRHPANASWIPPVLFNATKWGEVTSGHACADMAAANLKVVELSDDLEDVKTKLDAMRPYLWTHIAVGVEFGLQMLSPVGIFGGAEPLKKENHTKVFVLLSDGMQTAPGWGPGDSYGTAEAESNMSKMCKVMKDAGVQVYTVGYDLTDQHTLDLLKACANTDNFYNASDVNAGLASTFKDIGKRVHKSLVYVAE